MPTAVENVEMGDGSVIPPPIGDKGQMGDGSVLPPPIGDKGKIHFRRNISILLLLLLLLFLGGVFAPPGFLALLLNFTIPTDQLEALQCPTDQVGDPTGITDGTHGGGGAAGNTLPAVQDEDPTSNGLLLPAVQKVKPTAFSGFMFDVFMWLNDMKLGMGMDGFVPPNPCMNQTSQPPDPQQTPGAGGGTTGGGSSSTQPTEVAECGPGWLPASDCTCCGSTLVCADGSIGEFNPQCTGSGETACTCVPNTNTAAVAGGYICAETGAACTP